MLNKLNIVTYALRSIQNFFLNESNGGMMKEKNKFSECTYLKNDLYIK